jgi:alkylation response protein AidB-like acyl-CoA dehydrogenase
MVDANNEPVLSGGQPDTRMLLFPASEAEILDTWNVSGLCGTGSHDIAVQKRFVPRARAVSLVDDAPQDPGRLYRFPVFGLLALGIAAVALGIARRAIDELVELAAHKRPAGSRKRLAERSAVQAQVAQAEAGLRAARAFLFESVAQAWDAAGMSALAPRQRAALRLAATHATTTAAEVVTSMYHAGGASSIYATMPLQRCFRDVHVATQHVMVAAPTYELTGRVLLDIDTDIRQL